MCPSVALLPAQNLLCEEMSAAMLTWTRDRPQEPGWYKYRGRGVWHQARNTTLVEDVMALDVPSANLIANGRF